MKRKLNSDDCLVSTPLKKKFNWNETIQNPDYPRQAVNQAWVAAYTAYSVNDQTLLNELLSELKHLKYLDWNSNPRDTGKQSYGISLAWLAVQLAHDGKPLLFAELLKLPEILLAIHWDAAPQFVGHPQENKSVIVRIFDLFGDEKINSSAIPLKNLINDNILLTFSWDQDVVKEAFYRMFNKNESIHKNFMECDIALAELSESTLQKFSLYFTQPLYKDLSAYLMQIIFLKVPSPILSFPPGDSSNPISSLRSATAHLTVARNKTTFKERQMHFDNVATLHPLYFEAQYELMSLHLLRTDEYKTELPVHKDLRLKKAFEHACRWAHYDKEEKKLVKLNAITRIVTEMFSPPDRPGVLSEPPNITGQTNITTKNLINTLVKSLNRCQAVEVYHLTQDFLNRVKIFKLQAQIDTFSSKIRLLESKKTEGSSVSYSSPALGFFGNY